MKVRSFQDLQRCSWEPKIRASLKSDAGDKKQPPNTHDEEIAGLTLKKITMLTVVENMQCRSKVEIVMKATLHIAAQKCR